MIPGELLVADGDIDLNADRKTVTVNVENIGDRPIQVGSHYHFYETNSSLRFERETCRGYRLDIPAGAAVRRRGWGAADRSGLRGPGPRASRGTRCWAFTTCGGGLPVPDPVSSSVPPSGR